MGNFLRFGIFEKIQKLEVVRKVREEATSLDGAGPPPGRAVRACGHLVCLPDSVFMQGNHSGLKKSLYILPFGLTPASRRFPLFFVSSLFSAADLGQDVVPGM